MSMKFFLSRRLFAMCFIKIISFTIRLKYFISPLFIALPCFIIVQNLAFADMKSELINSRVESGVAILNNFEQSISSNSSSRIKINQDCQNIGYKFRFGVSDNSIVTNVIDRSPSDNSTNNNDNGRDETNKRQCGFWYGWQWYLLSIVTQLIILVAASCLGWFGMKWLHEYGPIYTFSLFKNWVIHRFMKHGGVEL